jgi:ElaB/YqjD/DUF883 family membrane-anchored ribosome-binding protein
MGTQTSQPLFSRAKASELFDRAKASEIFDATQDLLPKIEKICRERPWTAITFGVALGFLARGLLSRR